MRTVLVAIVVLAACKGKDKGGDTTKVESKPAGPTAPTVKVATVLAKDEAKPPFLYLVDDAGTVKLAAAKSWADVDANALKISKRVTQAREVERYVREEYAMGRDPAEAIATWDESSDIDLAALEDPTDLKPSAQDDPPPPEEEDKPDDGKDESGGTGTAMALEEGKMGKKDSDRAEGQYKMQKNQEDPQLARQQAIEQARAAGILANGKGAAVGGGAFGRGMPSDDGTASRMADTAGIVMRDGKLDPLRAMIVIAPTAKATALIEIVRETDSAIAVSYNGKVRPLRLQFGFRDSDLSSSSWLEARVSTKGIVVEAVPDKPLDVAALDQLGAAIDKARTTRGIEGDAPVDVLVDPDVDAQRFIDVVVALDLAGVKVIGMGKAVPAEELARRGHRTPAVRIGQPNAQGDLDKREIRKVVKNAATKIKACYEKALQTEPTLSGIVQVQFFIKPNGTVASADAHGVSPDVATCVAGVVKALSFPKPNGGGGVQVNYPFTMRN